MSLIVGGLLAHLVDTTEQDVAVAFAVAIAVSPNVGSAGAGFLLNASKCERWTDHV
jgi:hypothetical protein